VVQIHAYLVHTSLAQAGHLDAAAFVVAHGPDIFRAQAEFAAGHEGAGYLAPRAQDFTLESDLSAQIRVFRYEQKRIGGVETDAHQIEFCAHRTTPKIMSTSWLCSWTRLRTSEM